MMARSFVTNNDAPLLPLLIKPASLTRATVIMLVVSGTNQTNQKSLFHNFRLLLTNRTFGQKPLPINYLDLQ